MTRLSLSLLLITAVAGSFAACSSSSDDSSAPSGGSAGQAGGAGASEAGEPGVAGSSDHAAGGASESAGGETGAAGAGAGEATSGAAGTDTSGGVAGEPNGASGSAGNPGGGASTGGSGGSAGTSGSAGNPASGGTGGSVAACDQAAHTAFANGLPAYFLAHVVKQDCFANQTEGSGSDAITECAGNGCTGSVGCASNLVWHDAAYDATTGQFTVQVDISSALTLTQSAAMGGATCTLNAQDSNAPINAALATVDNGTSLSARLDTLAFPGGSPSASGCAAVSDIATVTSDATNTLLARAAEDAVTTLDTYQVACD